MFKFEWDDQKPSGNMLKHGVTLDEAVSVFADELALTFFDPDHFENEERSRTYGISNKGEAACGGSHGAPQWHSNH